MVRFSKHSWRKGYAWPLAFILVAPSASMSAQTNPAHPIPATSQAETLGTQPGGYYGQQLSVESIDLTTYELIRDEGVNNGKAMDFASALCEGIGPRLPGSPYMKKANEWTRDALTRIGLENSHLEDWDEFGMGRYQVNSPSNTGT